MQGSILFKPVSAVNKVPANSSTIDCKMTAAAQLNLKPSVRRSRKPRDHGLLLIVAGKLLYGIFLVAAGVAALNLIGKNPAFEIHYVAGQLGLDSRSYYIRWLMHEISGVGTEQLAVLSVATFFYAILSFVEGFGLAVGKQWARWLTIFDTGSFVPVEIYELCKELNWFKFGVLVLNVFTVAYLLWQIKKSPR